MAKFVHLHGHSEYSLLDGLSKIKKLVKTTKELGMPAIAITDHGAMYGAIEFYKAAHEENIKPVIGCEVYVAKRSHKDKEGKVDTEPFHLTLLAKNNQGYQNLMKLVSIAYLEGYYYRPRVDRELLREFHEGIIALSGCPSGEFIRSLKNGNYEEGEEIAKKYLEIFGEGNYFLELQNHEYSKLLKNPDLDARVRQDLAHMEEVEAISLSSVKDLSKKLGIQIVATNDYHYIDHDDVQAQDALLCVQTGRFVKDEDRLRMVDIPNLYVRSSEEMSNLFHDLPEAIETSVKIAENCNVELNLGKPIFPIFDIPQGLKDIDYLRQLCNEKFDLMFPKNNAEYRKRIDYELSVIEAKKFATYILIVSDFINWAHTQGIITNTRGSAAGSLVLYVLEVTNIDPIAYMLPFERFMNPLRPKFPDIDSDIADDRRDDVIRYVMEKYGHDKVAHIVTFGTMMGRAAIRDIGRVLAMPYGDVDRIAKLVPPPHQGFHKNLADVIKEVPELGDLYKNNAEIKTLLDLAQKVEGTVRHASVHAAGLVISPTPMTDYAPLQREANGDKVVSQYDMFSISEDYEGVGLIKLDLLGIRNLSILGRATEIVKANQGIEIDLNNLPLDDKKTYELLGKGNTMGLFQLEGSGMTRYLVDLQPTNIFDISAMVALYRPGPLSIIPEYIARKHNPRLIKYFDPRMKDFLERSLGLLVYQDDVLLTTINIAGYNWEEADKFRKAMGKKNPAEMAKQKDHFIEGCIKNGLDHQKAEELFKLIEPFAAYGFNKCISGDTVLYDATSGKRMTVRKLYQSKNKICLFSIKKDQTLKAQPMTSIQENGIKAVFEITTRRGLSIKATDNHPFLLFDGWIELKDLKIGDRIGTARRAPLPQKAYLIESFKLVTLGYLLAEGNFCHPSGVYFYSKSEEEIEDFINNAQKFNNSRISINSSKQTRAIYIGRQAVKVENALFEWIKELGLYNKKAVEKSIPDFVFQLNDDQLSIFLAKMWQGDGCISESENCQFYYATSSKKMAFQMQHLLLRLGVISTVHKKKFKYQGGMVSGLTINFSRFTNIQAFSETIGQYLVGEPLRTLHNIFNNHPIISGKLAPIIGRGSKDIIPAMVLPLMREEVYRSNSSLQGFAMECGISDRLLFYDTEKTGYLRETVQKMANILDSDQLSEIGNSDIYWDEVVRIEPKGLEMTYDLTIPETHNFVANDIIVHNSHAASYAMVAYQTAYMKANFTAEFMAAVMTAEYGDADKISAAMDECKRLGIVVLPPDINKSKVGFTLENLKELTEEELSRQIGDVKTHIHQQAIRFGLSAIKNVGISAIESILKSRNASEFKSLGDLCSCVDNRLVNKKTLESLIKSGAMDRLGTRAGQLFIMDQILEKVHQNSPKTAMGQVGLFGAEEEVSSINIKTPDIEELSLDQMLIFEKNLLGFYLHEPPYMDLLKQISPYISHKISEITEEVVGNKVVVGGVIFEVKKVMTKKSQSEMAFIRISDTVQEIEAVIFPKTFESAKNFLEKDQVVIAWGRIDNREDKLSLVIDNITVFDPNLPPDMVAASAFSSHSDYPVTSKPKLREVEIIVPKNCGVEILQKVNKTLRGYPGKLKVAVLLPGTGNDFRVMDLPFGINMEPLLVEEIEGLLGKGTVKLT